MSVITHDNPKHIQLYNYTTTNNKDGILSLLSQVGVNQLFSGMNTPQTALALIIKYGTRHHNTDARAIFLDTIRELLSRGACPHLAGHVSYSPQQPVHLRDPHTQIFSALYWAVYTKACDVIKIFIEFNVDFRRYDSILQYLILYPTQTDYEIFKLMALNGANINCKVYSGKVYPTLLDFYKGYYVTGHCNENEYAKKIKKILEKGIQPVIEEEKRLELEKIKKCEAEKVRIELENAKRLDDERKRIELENVRKCEEQKRIELENIQRRERENEQNFIQTQQVLLNRISQFTRNMETLHVTINNENKKHVYTANEIKIFENEFDELASRLLNNSDVAKINHEITSVELTTHELEKLTFDQRTEYFDKIKSEIVEAKIIIQKKKSYMNDVILNSDFLEKREKKEVIVKVCYDDLVKSFGKINEEYEKIFSDVVTIQNNYSGSKHSHKHYVAQLEANNTTFERFKKEQPTSTGTIFEKLDTIKSNEKIVIDKSKIINNKMKNFVETCKKLSEEFPVLEVKLSELDRKLDKKLEDIEKKKSYDKIEAGTYIKLALDQIQSISIYGDNVPKELKEYYGKNIAHLLIQAKKKMPPDLLAELVPKLPESFHAYLTGDDIPVNPPWITFTTS
jgi:hypothetical protein